MASLYTPEPQRTGLDWLAGMVRSGQELAQQERRLQLAKKQQQIQAEHFWAGQARLKDQQEFQNRKFLYDVAHDQRTELRQSLLDERNYQHTQFTERNMTRDDEWRRDPTNPYVANVVANTGATNARTNWEFGDGSTGGGGTLFPESLPTGGDGATDALLGSPEGREDFTPSDATSTVPKANNPYEVHDIGGRKLLETRDLTPAGNVRSRHFQLVPVDKDQMTPETMQALQQQGLELTKVTINGVTMARPKASKEEDLNKEIAQVDGTLARLESAKVSPPAYPVGPQVTQEQKDAHKEKSNFARTRNAEVDAQLQQTTKRSSELKAKQRLINTPLSLSGDSNTPFFQEVAPVIDKAIKDKNPRALDPVRAKAAALAAGGDPNAQAAVQWMDEVLGVSGPAVPKKTVEESMDDAIKQMTSE